MKLFIFLLLFWGYYEAQASALNMVLSGKVVSVQDRQSGDKVIQKGGSAKAKISVTLVAGGAQERLVRQSLGESLPKMIKGTIETRFSSSGRVVQSVPVTFLANPNSMRCKNSISQEKVICQVIYRSDENNWVEISAQNPGYYSVGVNLKAPQNGAPIYSKNNESYEFMVEGNRATRSFASFSGLPEN